MSNAAENIEQELEEDLNEERQIATKEDDSSDDFEIEVVDDVAEDDKPRVKDYEGPDIPEDDEIESYSDRVQKRMKKLSFEAKEAERQRQALAQKAGVASIRAVIMPRTRSNAVPDRMASACISSAAASNCPSCPLIPSECMNCAR